MQRFTNRRVELACVLHARARHADATSAVMNAVTVYTRLLEAWNDRNAEAFAALFATDGVAIGFDGSEMRGRTAMVSELTRIFDSHSTATYVAIVRETRELNGVAIVRALAGMVPRGKRELNPATNALQSAVLASKAGGGFEIVLFQNTPAALHEAAALREQYTAELSAVVAAGVRVKV
jgi:uncharacterized protein (TIGR02246 family)